MPNDQPPPPAALEALQKLQKLAADNGLPADAIQLYLAEEKIYALDGIVTLVPLVETASTRYAGPSRGGNRRMVGTFANLKDEVERYKQSFSASGAWIEEALTQVKAQPGGGWGLDDVRVPLPNRSLILVGSEACPRCRGGKTLACQPCMGRGEINCIQCHGMRQATCYHCYGRGIDPVPPEHPCTICRGLRMAPCRFCQGRGLQPCPTCQGRRALTCTGCNGAGTFSEDVTITCSAHTQFRLVAEGLPSGLRRTLDRIGFAKLADGHAAIESVAPPPDEDEEALSAAPPEVMPPDAAPKKGPKPELHYRAQLPYIDLRMNVAGKRTIVGVFGKRQFLTDVPPFLDKALEGARQALRAAGRGGGKLEAVLDKRVMQDALKLQLLKRSSPDALRRLYPYGLSKGVAVEIAGCMRQALHRATLIARSLVALIGVGLAVAVFAGIFLTPFRAEIAQGWKVWMGLSFDLGSAAAMMAASWFALSAATRFVLQRRFPGFTIPLTQKTGMIGYAMLAAILVAFIAVLLAMPAKPAWTILLMKFLGFRYTHR